MKWLVGGGGHLKKDAGLFLEEKKNILNTFVSIIPAPPLEENIHDHNP